MNRTLISILLLTGSLGMAAPSLALDIPLSGATQAAGGTSLGYVDMERIFQIYPKTLAAKEDYEKQRQKKREQLAAKEQELTNIKNRIAVLESTVKGADAPKSEETGELAADAQPQSLPTMKQQLVDRQAELDDLRKQAIKDLSTFESQQSQLILGNIYQALRDLALEEQVTVVVDKSSILYGDAAIDLTEKLQQKVRGY
jgi:Skp family chaperone for outer membrane proteins